jgi:TolB-like protein
MNHSSISSRIVLQGMALCLGFAFAAAAMAADTAPPRRLLILPLTVHAEKELTYLQQGINDMLSSRLAQTDHMVPVDRETTARLLSETNGPIDHQKAHELGLKAEADYVVFGSVTVFGESISTDTKLLEVSSNQISVNFSQTGQSPGEIIGHIDNFAARINAELFGIQASATPTVAPTPQPQTQQQIPNKPMADAEAPSPPKVSPDVATAPTQLGTPWISRAFRSEIRGLDIGDVDGDGHNELVYIDHHNVHIYRYEQNQLIRMGEIKEKSYHAFLGVDVADINQNGKAEIFVSDLPTNQERLASFVLEWNGTQFVTISKDQNWYFRVMDAADGGRMLVGQKMGGRRQLSGSDGLFERRIHQLQWQDGRYLAGEPISSPLNSTVFSFSQAHLTDSDGTMTVSYNSSFNLRLSSTQDDDLWRNTSSSGSTNIYLELVNDASDAVKKRLYLPTRIRARDLTNDGKQEILVIDNQESMKALSNLKSFKGGRVACLSWNGLNLNTLWETEATPKFIADFDVADLDNDGKPELAYALVTKIGSGWSSDASKIVIQKIQ